MLIPIFILQNLHSYYSKNYKCVNNNTPSLSPTPLLPFYQKRCPHRLITASLAVSRQILHSNVLSWLLLSAAAEVLDPGPVAGFSADAAAAAEPEAGGAAAVAIDRTGLLKTSLGECDSAGSKLIQART